MKRIPFLLLFGAFQLFWLGCAAQPKPKPADYGIKSKKAMNLFLDGRAQENYRDYNKAIEYYEAALKLEPQFGEAYFRGGACYYVLKKYDTAGEWMDKAIPLLEKPHPIIFFYQAEARFFREKFEEALEFYNQFEAHKTERPVPKSLLKTATQHRKSAQFAAAEMKNRITFDPVNLGDNINTQFEEYLPYLTADEQTIFFTARRPGSTGGFNREYRDYTEDFFYSVLKDGEWQPAENLGPPVNTDLNEGAASFSPDGQYVFFTACHRKDGYGDCDIYVSRLDGREWSTPRNLGPLINTSGWESQPSISNDGKTLFFASNRKGGVGGQDIWYSQLEGNKWTEAVNLGKTINTNRNEMSPFLHADGKTLYFASNGHPGFGNLDLFLSKSTGDGWTTPENLGYPLNTSANEGNIFINAKGDVGYINSSREGGLGKGDLYSFELDEKIRPDFTTYVRGHVREKGSKKPLYAKVTFVNIQTGDTIRSVTTNKASGKFLLTLPLDQDYAAFVDKKGYLFASQFFSLRDIDRKRTQYFDVDIQLQPLEVGVTVVMNSIFYETNKFDLLDKSKAELEHLVGFMKLNPKVKVEIGGHTDDVGSNSDNQRLSEQRANAVRKYLLGRGVAENRVTAKGYGESKPIADNANEEGRALNRRTECRIVEVE